MAMAESIAYEILPGQEGYQDWYAQTKEKFNEKATKAATAEVDEKWLNWKAKELNRRAMAFDAEITAEARNNNAKYFIATASSLGLRCTLTDRSASIANLSPTCLAGKKHTASGSAPIARLPTLAPVRVELPAGTSTARPAHLSDTLRG
jgi:ribosomal protein S25